MKRRIPDPWGKINIPEWMFYAQVFWMGTVFIGIVNMIYVLNEKIAEMYAYFY